VIVLRKKKNIILLLPILLIVFVTGYFLLNSGDQHSNQVSTETKEDHQKEDSFASLTITANERQHEVSPTLNGLFFEDINYAADGGLYGEKVRNRSFEFEDSLNGWAKWIKGEGAGEITVNTSRPLNENNTHYVQISVTEPGSGAGIANKGYNGIAVESGEIFNFSIYARSANPLSKPLTVSLRGAQGEVFGACEIYGVTSNWGKYECGIESNATNTQAQLTITVAETAVVDLDMISLFPDNTWMNRPNGLRYDMANLLDELNPQFLRFPGGCIVEGGSIENYYKWKNTIGDITKRKTQPNQWAPQYYQSYGLGFQEYFLLAEDLGAEPLPIIYAGITSCNGNPPKIPVEDLQPYIDNALDLIEYANGDAKTTIYGAIRAENGHPEPYNLKYLGVGNELWGNDYFVRYKKFHDAIKAKYPDIQLIMSAGAFPDDISFAQAYEWLDKDGNNTDIVDEHMYQTPEWFINNVERYDQYDRSGSKVFVGEYAAHGAGRKNNVQGALAEAAFMTGLERNSDVVAMAAYAPLFAHTGYTQWAPNLIWFNNTEAYGTPNYYVQQMFSNHVGDYVLPAKISQAQSKNSKISGTILLGSWNTQVEYDDVTVTDSKGKILFKNNFKEKELSSNWDISGGNWRVANGVFKQISEMPDTRAVLKEGQDWSNYTLKLKARKVRGDEGMLIGFGVKGKADYYWWNLGGWGNTKTDIEKSVGGGKSIIGNSHFEPIEAKKWYDVEIQVEGNRIRAYLDGELIHDVTDGANAGQIFTSATEEETTGEIIVKVVNTSKEAQKTQVKVNGTDYIHSEAKAIVLQSDSLSAENSFANKTNIKPVETKLTGLGTSFQHEFPAQSVTVIRLQTTAEPIIDHIMPVEFTTVVGVEPQWPSTVKVTMSDGSEQERKVQWRKISKEQYNTQGLIKVKGTIEGTGLKAVLLLTIQD
jgi:alpha-L-arabinofuranosidase